MGLVLHYLACCDVIGQNPVPGDDRPSQRHLTTPRAAVGPLLVMEGRRTPPVTEQLVVRPSALPGPAMEQRQLLEVSLPFSVV